MWIIISLSRIELGILINSSTLGSTGNIYVMCDYNDYVFENTIMTMWRCFLSIQSYNDFKILVFSWFSCRALTYFTSIIIYSINPLYAMKMVWVLIFYIFKRFCVINCCILNVLQVIGLVLKENLVFKERRITLSEFHTADEVIIRF